MNAKALKLKNQSQQWLQENVIPLWSKNGIDSKNGSFIEALTLSGNPLPHLPRRCLVQARQIYSLLTAEEFKLTNTIDVQKIITHALQFMTTNYVQTSGAFAHSVSHEGKVINADLDLYTQAFALFALGCGFKKNKSMHYRIQALQIISYLNNSRKAKNGGYTEIKSNKTYFQSNPHMHLFEAALVWLECDPYCPEWRELADDLYHLCTNYFINKTSNSLCEHFDEGWVPQIVTNSSYIFEPGHHYEWAWLLSCYENLTDVDCKEIRHSLFSVAEQYGVNADKFVIDEVLSDFTIHKPSARFWPQCERIKAAVKLGLEVDKSQQHKFAEAADDALQTLFIYLIPNGLWQDTLIEKKSNDSYEFTKQDPKGSSLYHIMNAMTEYFKYRHLLTE